jgi:hypothetical protein
MPILERGYQWLYGTCVPDFSKGAGRDGAHLGAQVIEGRQ